MRMSVLIVNILSLYLSVLALGLELAARYVGNNQDEGVDSGADTMYSGSEDEQDEYDYDDYYYPTTTHNNTNSTHEESSNNNNNNHLHYHRIIMTFAMKTVFVFVHGCGIYGAMKQLIWPVTVAMLGYCLTIGVGIYQSDLLQIGCASVFLYPHFFFIREIKQQQQQQQQQQDTGGNTNNTNNSNDPTRNDDDDDDETVPCDDLSQAGSMDGDDDDKNNNNTNNNINNNNINNVESQPADIIDIIPSRENNV